MEKPSEVQFVDQRLKKAFDELKMSTTEDRQMHEWIARALADIQQNAFCGIQVPKNLMPREYVKKYGIKNLWKYNLPNAWRLLYSIEGHAIKIISIVLEWLSHKQCERKFKY